MKISTGDDTLGPASFEEDMHISPQWEDIGLTSEHDVTSESLDNNGVANSHGFQDGDDLQEIDDFELGKFLFDALAADDDQAAVVSREVATFAQV